MNTSSKDSCTTRFLHRSCAGKATITCGLFYTTQSSPSTILRAVAAEKKKIVFLKPENNLEVDAVRRYLFLGHLTYGSRDPMFNFPGSRQHGGEAARH